MNHDHDSIRYFVKNEELFNILHSTHIPIGHDGRDRITKETIIIFLSLCTDCHKKSNSKRGLVSKPIWHSSYISRTQIDLIDRQLQSIHNYRFLKNYQDHLTKFVILKSLKTKRIS